MKLDKRMKTYEYVTRNYLTIRTPVIIRIDGKAFHTFTKNLKKPFDNVLMESMQQTLKYLCENVQGCVFGYCQSDEISLVLVDYEKLDSCAWFDNNLNKIISITSSMASVYFNKIFNDLALDVVRNLNTEEDYTKILKNCREKLALFDSRAFNIPKEEVNNYFVWRQQDCIKNSIQMVGRTYFKHKDLDRKNGKDIIEMLKEVYNIDYYEDYTLKEQRGTGCKKLYGKWEIVDIPIFQADTEFINKCIYVGED